MSLFLFGNSCYKSKESFKIFSPQILEVYRILLVKTTLESIIFYYTFSVINTMFVLCTPTLKQQQLQHWNCRQLYWAFLLESVWFLFWFLNNSGITSHGTDSFRVEPITPGHPIPKISTRLFSEGVPERQCLWKQSTDKRGHHQKKNQTDSTRNAQ